MARLVHRIEPIEAAPVLWSGRDFPDALTRDMWLEALVDGFLPDAGFPWLAASADPAAALTQIQTLGNSVVLTIRGAVNARDLRPVMQKLTENADSLPAIFIEAGARFRIVKATEGAHGVTHVTIEPA
jgi:hypothetical protein